jgi:hypothetical protein
MPALDPKVETLVKKFSGELEVKLLGRLRSVVLYGSAAAGTHVAGQSDLNFMIEVERVDAGVLDDLAKLYRGYADQGVAVPLVVDPEYLQHSLDVFPIEFAEMQAFHRVLFGNDPLTGLEINADDLRRQAEFELKQKLLALRRLYLTTAGRGQDEDRLLFSSYKSFLVVIRALLRHLGEAKLLVPHGELLGKIEQRLQVKLPSFRQLAEARGGPLKLKGAARQELILSYLEEVAELARAVDGMGKTNP